MYFYCFKSRPYKFLLYFSFSLDSKYTPLICAGIDLDILVLNKLMNTKIDFLQEKLGNTWLNMLSCEKYTDVEPKGLTLVFLN